MIGKNGPGAVKTGPAFTPEIYRGKFRAEIYPPKFTAVKTGPLFTPEIYRGKFRPPEVKIGPECIEADWRALLPGPPA